MSSSKKHRKPEKKLRDPSPSLLHILPEPSPSLFPSKGDLLKLVVVLVIAASVAIACNYAANLLNRRPKPFCGDGGEGSRDLFSDVCEPCPDNGKCSNGELECDHGYRKQGRICIEDGEVNQTAKELAEWVEHHVCEAYARVLCDEAGKIWFQETDIMKILDESSSKDNVVWRDYTFAFSKQKVMETLESFLEKRAILNGSKEYKCPDVLAELYKPLRCCIREWIYKHLLLVVAVSALLMGFVRFLWIIRKKQYLSSRAEQLYEQVCDILEDNAMMAKSMNSESEPWVVASWLRDHLLLPKERKNVILWKKVEELILEDSRIDQYPKLIKGEQKIVLEWQAGSSLSSKTRAKRTASRVKIGSGVHISTTHQEREAKLQQSLNS